MISLVHPSRGHITQFYGARQVDGNPHAGQDYAYSNGAEIFPEVFAAADGVVLFAGDSRGLAWPNIMYLNIDFDRTDGQDSSAGNYAIIAHHDAAGNRVALTGYGHQENVWVNAGDTVRAGQRIGTVGETGFSAGKHLHFDLVLAPFDVDDAPYYGRVNPNPYFTTGTTYNLASGQLGSTTTTLEEDDMPTLDEIWNHGIEDPNEPGKFIPAYEWLRMANIKAGRAEAAALGVDEEILYGHRDEEGRNLVDRQKQTLWNSLSGAPGESVNVPELAKALAEQLAAVDVQALAAQLQITVKESK